MRHTHSYVVLPVHPPEVDDRVRQRALSCDVGLWAIHALQKQRGCYWDRHTTLYHEDYTQSTVSQRTQELVQTLFTLMKLALT